MPGDKPVLDVKHVLRTAYLEEYDEFLYRIYVMIPPYGKVRILIKGRGDDITLAQLVQDNGSFKQYHSHYGPIKYDDVEGFEIIKVIRELTDEQNEIRPLIGLDGWLRLSGDDMEIKRCLNLGVESECFNYIKVHEMVIFPSPGKK